MCIVLSTRGHSAGDCHSLGSKTPENCSRDALWRDQGGKNSGFNSVLPLIPSMKLGKLLNLSASCSVVYNMEMTARTSTPCPFRNKVGISKYM